MFFRRSQIWEETSGTGSLKIRCSFAYARVHFYLFGHRYGMAPSPTFLGDCNDRLEKHELGFSTGR